MDDDDDPFAYIASIEQSAPQDQKPANQHRCADCDIVLEEIEGKYVCPSCGTEANILEVEETEMNYDEMGRAIVGQGVNLKERTKKHQIDFGWAWSSDEAIVDVLSRQITALEECGLIPELFRQGVKNMWLKYWIDHVAPFIKDQYNENDLVPIEAIKVLSFRDIEVLVKVRDKVVLPERTLTRPRRSKRIYKMYGSNFYEPSHNVSTDERVPTPEPDLEQQSRDESIMSPNEDLLIRKPTNPTGRLDLSSISILTLDRTLAFIEATARCMDLARPIFASDLVRACCQRVIPLFGAHKTLPEGMNLNERDRMMFRKMRPPSPIQLSRAASLLVHKVYSDRLPKLTPVPALERILERFIIDMNLPYDLMNNFTDSPNFSSFKHTRPILLQNSSKIAHWPQYDRWGFAILLAQLKKLFSFIEESVIEQSERAREESRLRNENIFILHDWLRQISFRLNFILTYDSYAIYHPMTELSNLQPTSQLYKYIATSLNDRVSSTTRVKQKLKRYEETFREELTEFIAREIPKPFPKEEFAKERELEKPRDISSPMQDAFNRTKRFWMPLICDEPDISDLISKDFSCCKLLLPEKPTRWTIYDNGCPMNMKFEISRTWPYWFRLLLSVGGYLCYCQPRELLREFRFVEEYLYPEMNVIRRRRRFT